MWTRVETRVDESFDQLAVVYAQVCILDIVHGVLHY